MTNNKKKPLMEIPATVIETLVDLISDPTEEGRKKIIDLAEQAKVKYKYWLFYFTRTRDINSFITDLNTNDSYFRWEAVKKLLSEGEWNNGSYNFYFLLELACAIEGYESLEEQEQLSFVHKLKEPIMNRLNYLIGDHKKALEEEKRRKEELLQAGLAKQRLLDSVLIEQDLEVAKNKAATEADKNVFCLVKDANQWKLSLVDATGKVFPLEITLELKLFLSRKKITEITKLSSEQLEHIVTECQKAKIQLLDRLQIMINPEQSNTDIVNKGINSVFVLRIDPPKANLWWISSLGALNFIELKDYPLLNECLTNNLGLLHDNNFNEATQKEMEHSIKLHLLGVKTAKALNSTTVSQMNRRLGSIFNRQMGQENIEEIKQNAHERALDLLQCMINPQQRNRDLQRMHITSTFILRHTEKEHSLWWANSLSRINQISLKDYPELQHWLETHPAPFNAEDELTFKNYLLTVNPIHELDKKSFQNIKDMLENRLKGHVEEQVEPAQEAIKAPSKIDASFNEGAQKVIPQPLSKDRYTAISQLPNIWHEKRIRNEAVENAEELSRTLNAI
ncbi:hypothetical protein [Legionella saoudiensis]|uniref:hypothetical protein n=1 Tax=Legionella saoudiensis TaxID=1750561 RepID=UPI000731DA5C|nr:hypothetical protein [Legionella saoudiensis]